MDIWAEASSLHVYKFLWLEDRTTTESMFAICNPQIISILMENKTQNLSPVSVTTGNLLGSLGPTAVPTIRVLKCPRMKRLYLARVMVTFNLGKLARNLSEQNKRS